MAKRKPRQPKYEYLRLDGRVDLVDEVVCIPCNCVSGYGPPPAVGECSCPCHDTARLWWCIYPYTEPADVNEPGAEP